VDHYETLEVSRNASPEVIRAAYRSLMQRLHPDKLTPGQDDSGRAARIAQAYEVLSDPVRRVVYDRALDSLPVSERTGLDQVRPPAGSGHPVVVGASGGAATSGQSVRSARTGAWALFLVVVLGGAWAWLSWDAKPADVRAELAAIRQGFDAADLTESQRRQMDQRRRDILEGHPELRAIESAEKAEAMAARTVALLEAPLSVQVVATPSVGRGPVYELSIDRISLLVGTFDAQRHLSHLARHRDRLIGALAERLSQADPTRLAGPQAGAYLRELMLGSVVTALGTDPKQAYPSTYFESPGRYGVVDLVLPDSFRLVQIAPWQE